MGGGSAARSPPPAARARRRAHLAGLYHLPGARAPQDGDDEPAELTDLFLDTDVEQPELEQQSTKLHRRIVHGKTRCWSAVDSAASILMTREANNEFFTMEANLEDSAYNLTPSEYQAMYQIVGIATDIVDVERYVEGSQYGAFCHVA